MWLEYSTPEKKKLVRESGQRCLGYNIPQSKTELYINFNEKQEQYYDLKLNTLFFLFFAHLSQGEN
jgi:hypothetical protein